MIVSWPGTFRAGLIADSRSTSMSCRRSSLPRVSTPARRRAGWDLAGPASAEGLDLFGGQRREAFVLEHATDSDVVESVPPYCGVRTDDGWMYARYSGAGSPDDGFEDLFDVDADPLQQHNLAHRQVFESDRLRLRALARTLCDPTPPGYDWRV